MNPVPMNISNSSIIMIDEDLSLFEPLPWNCNETTTSEDATLLLRVLSPSPESSPNFRYSMHPPTIDPLEALPSSSDMNNHSSYLYSNNFGPSNFLSSDCPSSTWNQYDTILPSSSSNSDFEGTEYYTPMNDVHHHSMFSSPTAFSPIDCMSTSQFPVPPYEQQHWQQKLQPIRMGYYPQENKFYPNQYPMYRNETYSNSSVFPPKTSSSPVVTKRTSSSSSKSSSSKYNRRRPQITVYPRQFGPISFPRDNDVLSGRGGRINCHVGNVQFRNMVAQVRDRYLDPKVRKLEKAHIAAEIVYEIRYRIGGCFLVEDEESGLWYDIGDKRAIRKTAQALRENVPSADNDDDNKNNAMIDDDCDDDDNNNNNNTSASTNEMDLSSDEL